MALNDIQLNSQLLVSLYKNSLIEINEGESAQEKLFAEPAKVEEIKPESAEWKFLGEFRKSILLAVNYKNTTYLPDDQLNFLTSVLGACKLGLADVAILNLLHAPSTTYKDVQEKFKSKVTILFGITPGEFEMPVNFPEFQVQALNNCTFLHTPILEKLESDKVLKSKLWVCLRKMFGV